MLLFLDGMGHYDTTRIATKYSAVSSVGCTWAVTAEGRFGNCLKRTSLSNVSGSGYVTVSPLTTRQGVWTPATSGVCGFAIKVDDVSRVANSVVHGSTPEGLVTIVEGSTYHLTLHLNADGTFSLIRNEPGPGGSTKVLAQSTEGLTSATWMYVECKWVIHPTAGSFVLRVNGTIVLSYTGDTTENQVNNTLGIWNGVQIGQVPSQSGAPLLTLRICDLYLADLAFPATDDVHDFLGDGTIVTLMPNGAGAAGWTPSAGANWDAVNDRPAPDDDGTYIATTTTGVTDLYQFEDIPAGAIVKAAQLSILARKETEGAAAIAPLVQPPSSGVQTGPAQGVASLLYDRYLTQPYDLNPATGVRFTAADINNGQFGLAKTT